MDFDEHYSLARWQPLTPYIADGDLPIDNNATERSLRGVAVVRRNWTFFGSDAGGETAAVLLSFVASCRLAGVDVFAWFRDVLTRLAEGHPVNRLRELLPHVWQAAHGFPQFTVSQAIAAGSSGTSEPWYVFLPFQLLLLQICGCPLSSSEPDGQPLFHRSANIRFHQI